jgi:Flp pilus assembly protein TadG
MRKSWLHRLLAIFPDRRAAVSPLLALMIVPLFGAVGMASEASSWFLIQRAAQNAADAAVLAAASNACDAADACHTVQLSPTYADEAKAVSASYNFVDSQNNTTVVAQNKAACPSGGSTCYQVTVTRTVPISLVRLVGYSGNTATSGVESIVATAIANAPIPAGYCSVALGTGNKAFVINGGPNVNMAGCDLFSNGDLTCDGTHADTGVPYGYANGSSTCGATQVSSQPKLGDPFSGLDANPPIPNHIASCANAFKNVTSGVGALATPNSLAAIGSTDVFECGDTKLANNIAVTTANTVLTIYNGQLDLNGHTLSTSGAGSLTIIFSGTVLTANCKHALCYNHIPVDTSGAKTGTINIVAPTTGALKGVAIMQDSRLNGTGNLLDIIYNGNNPSLGIQGLLYFPNSNLTISGAINKYALSCIGIVALTITVGGNGSIFANDAVGLTQDCPQAGLSLPTVPGTVQTRQVLVQ